MAGMVGVGLSPTPTIPTCLLHSDCVLLSLLDRIYHTSPTANLFLMTTLVTYHLYDSPSTRLLAKDYLVG